ncbi:DNA-directed RNA polymerase III subunit RPC4 [Leptidea sinapis]|uniref:DNA-directed RNA polymerase III subunit RPC4 n=1 Tax=Leptidea sinapis TaxID=189913 RepID=UPI0021391B44|nr:DNA-directed RNA polymerase III subunit RPC4 [Leptidea sinapis]
MSNPNDNSNTNCLESNPLQRLASLKPPRDLKLGGVKPNKKVFTPNLNVSRNKNKGPTGTTNREQGLDEKNRNKRRNEKNKNFKNVPNVIKSSGVFSEGLGSAERHSSRGSYNREANAAPTLQRPTIRVKDVIKIDNELEDSKIKAALSEDGQEVEAAEDFKNVLDVDAPVRLPMDDGGMLVMQKAVHVKQEVVVKQEPSDDDHLIKTEQKPMLDVKEVFDDTSVANLIKSDKPSLILLQLADTLPGRGVGGAAGETGASDPGDDEKPVVESRCRLSDLEEGRLGRLRVHRSGRVTMLLGNTVFEVSSGTKASFHQEAVSLSLDEASRSANLVSLGPLQHKLNVTPHWETLFNDLAIRAKNS